VTTLDAVPIDGINGYCFPKFGATTANAGAVTMRIMRYALLPITFAAFAEYLAGNGFVVVLGEAHVLRDDYPAAIESYERILEEFPDDARAKTRLESLPAR
jgi:hypothetical protein